MISGHREAIERAVALAKDKGAKRAVLLPVSAPFHCPLMQPAADAMETALADARIDAPLVPVFANVTAAPVATPDDDPRAAGRAGDRHGALARIGAGDGGAGVEQIRRIRRQGARPDGQAHLPPDAPKRSASI